MGESEQKRRAGAGASTRRDLLIATLGVAAGIVVSPLANSAIHGLFSGGTDSPQAGDSGVAAPGWTFSPRNPVLDILSDSGWEDEAVFDPSVAQHPGGALWMWYSTRGKQPGSIALATDASGAGDAWARFPGGPILRTTPPESRPYTSISRPSVIQTAAGWRMWYSVNDGDSAWIGAATSPDGIGWAKHGTPVLTPRERWEKSACQCPNVIYDGDAGLFKMWYCGGEVYEPDAVGYATSRDGFTWTRVSAAPIFTPASGWEDDKIGSLQVSRVGGWYYAFYNAFQRTPFISRIGMARSQDGVSAWERHPRNPLLSPGKSGSWNAAMMYKPTALWNVQKQRWDVWFNASDHLNGNERIGHAWSDGLW